MSKFLRESQSGFDRIDTESGVIYGVKVLGPKSRNGRVYEDNAIRRAVPMYEGVTVNLNHIRNEPNARVHTERPIQDRWGVLRNVRYLEGSIYADLHYLKNHPMTPQLVEAAQRFPETFGLSHDAGGDEQVIDGERRVVELFEIRSVDVVADPATNDGLFESYQPAASNVSAIEARMQRKASRMKLLEVRCPTGKGGGIDNSCKRKSSGKGVSSKPTTSKGFTGISSADASKYKISKNDAEFINELAKQGRLETSVEDIQRRERKWNLTPSKVGKFKGDLAVPKSGAFAGVPVRIEGWSGLQASAGPDMKMLPSGKPTGYIVSVHDKEPYGSYTVGRIVIPMNEIDGTQKMESRIQRRNDRIAHLLEVRCPTGKGGGIDNSCKRKSSGGGAKSPSKSELHPAVKKANVHTKRAEEFISQAQKWSKIGDLGTANRMRDKAARSFEKAAKHWDSVDPSQAAFLRAQAGFYDKVVRGDYPTPNWRLSKVRTKKTNEIAKESSIERRDENIDYLLEVRCPTGKGGGIDNSCKRKSSGGGGGKYSQMIADAKAKSPAEQRKQAEEHFAKNKNVLDAIAKKELGLETTDTRNSDRLDFSETSVWSMRNAGKAAFKAGAGRDPNPSEQKAIDSVLKREFNRDSLETTKSGNDFSEISVGSARVALADIHKQGIASKGAGKPASKTKKLTDKARFARAERRAERYQKKGMRMEDKGNTMVQGAGSNDRQASKGYELMRAGNRMTAKAQTIRKAIAKVSEPVASE